MARIEPIKVEIIVKGIYQRCPVCEGRGTVPTDFYACLGASTTTARDLCRRCHGTGTIAMPTDTALDESQERTEEAT